MPNNMPRPASSIAQVPGSGTGAAATFHDSVPSVARSHWPPANGVTLAPVASYQKFIAAPTSADVLNGSEEPMLLPNALPPEYATLGESAMLE